jgi:hypothetical protein
MRYCIIRIGASGRSTRPSFRTPILSEPGSKDLRFPNDNFNTNTFTVVEEKEGIKIARGPASWTGSFVFYLLIPETHLMFNSGMLITEHFDEDKYSHGPVYDAVQQLQYLLYELFEQLHMNRSETP